MQGNDEPHVIDVSALRMREATIAAGIWLTLAIGAFGELYVALTWQRPHRAELAILFALSMAAVAVVAMLPRRRIVRSRLREPFFLCWTVLDLVMLVLGTTADGGSSSPLVLLFFVPVVFSSMSYPLGSVVAVGLLSVASYVGVAIATEGSSVAYEGGFALSLLCTAAVSARQARNHKRQHAVLALASRTDPLTGILNRRGFEERMDAEIQSMSRHSRTGAIVMLDLDRFKPVNDAFGHAAGDEMLCWVAATIKSAVRPGDEVGRVGGDEFAILLRQMGSAEAQATVARVEAALQVRAPASIGVALYPDDAVTLDALMRCADARLYASRRGREQQQQHAVQRPPGPGPRAGADGGGLVDEIDASVIVTDMAGQVMSWNSGAESLYGWSSEEAVGRNARELMVPEDARAAEQLVVELSRDGRWDGELLVRRRDGSLFTAYVRNRLVLDEHHSPVAIVGVAVDISARVAAEQELLQSRNYAQAVAECIGDGMLTFDVDGLLTFVNQTAEKLLGWRAEELRGRPVDTLLAARAPDGGTASFQASPMARALSDSTTVRGEDELFLTAMEASCRSPTRPLPSAPTTACRAAWSCSATSASASAKNRSSGATPTHWRASTASRARSRRTAWSCTRSRSSTSEAGAPFSTSCCCACANATVVSWPPASSCRWPRTTP